MIASDKDPIFPPGVDCTHLFSITDSSEDTTLEGSSDTSNPILLTGNKGGPIFDKNLDQAEYEPFSSFYSRTLRTDTASPTLTVKTETKEKPSVLENSTISTRDDDIVLPSTPTTDSPPFLEINSAEVDDSGVHLLNSCGNRVDRDGQHIPEPELRRLVTASIQQPLQRTANPVDKDTSDEWMRLWEEEFDRLERN